MTVAALLRDLRARGVVLEPAGEYLDVDYPAGALTAADLEALRQRKRMVLAFLRWEQRGRAPVLLSSAWPGSGSWQHAYAVEGRHPLWCDRCQGRTVRALPDGRVGCPRCSPGALA